MSNKTLIILALVLAIMLALLLWLKTAMPGQLALTDKAPVCTMEAKICPDGSSVGRSGPDCEFAACPESSPVDTQPAPGTKVVVTAKLGESVVALGETIVLSKVTEDSRCPTDVQCIWAGTTKVQGTVTGGMGTAQFTFELGKTYTTEVNALTFTSVAPVPKSTTEIRSEDYTFTFEITRR